MKSALSFVACRVQANLLGQHCAAAVSCARLVQRRQQRRKRCVVAILGGGGGGDRRRQRRDLVRCGRRRAGRQCARHVRREARRVQQLVTRGTEQRLAVVTDPLCRARCAAIAGERIASHGRLEACERLARLRPLKRANDEEHEQHAAE